MKKTLTIFMAVVMIASCLSLAACGGKDSKNVFADLEGFDSYVAEDADILGYWHEVLPEDSEAERIEWDFYDTTTLHITEVIDGISYSNTSAYNYNEETGVLTHYTLQDKKTHEFHVEVSGETMTFKDASGAVVKTFERVYLG